MYFNTKNTLKSNRKHTLRQPINLLDQESFFFLGRAKSLKESKITIPSKIY
jgi:hypothetical protein